MKVPLTAIALLVEFTRISHEFLIAILLAVAGSVSVFYLCTENHFQPIWRPGSVHISTLLSKFVDRMARRPGGGHRNPVIAPHLAALSLSSRGDRNVASEVLPVYGRVSEAIG